MESVNVGAPLNSATVAPLFNWKLVGVGLVIGAIICAIVYFLFIRRDTTPKAPEGFEDASGNSVEGFGGVANGAGVPACLRNSAEAAALSGVFLEKVPRDSADLMELNLLLSKLACFQKDLLSPSHIIDATRSLEFATAHDREPVADTTARCFNKTIPQRDLEISLDTWKERGDTLVKRLSIEGGLKGAEVDNVKDLFARAWEQCRDVARQQCLSGEPTIVGEYQPRQPREFSPGELDTYGEYKEAPWN